MFNIFRIKFVLAVAVICALRPGLSLADDLYLTQLDPVQFNVVFMRHALAPGFGDPENFDVNDCSSQRNLDHQGRAQALEIGQTIAQFGVEFDQIYSSQWCRCQDTARLLGMGPYRSFAGLNSFFQNHAPREATLTLLRQKLRQLPADRLTLMVTHQVVINAMTGRSVPSGSVVAYDTRTGQSKRLILR